MAGLSAAAAISEAVRENILGDPPRICWNAGEPQPLGLFYDLDVFENGLRDVQQAFGEGCLFIIGIGFL